MFKSSKKSKQSLDLLVKTLAFPIVLNCKQCESEFCAAKNSPAHKNQLCLTCAALAWFNEEHRTHSANTAWFTCERYKIARMLAKFCQHILVQRYLPYIPKMRTEPEA